MSSEHEQYAELLAMYRDLGDEERHTLDQHIRNCTVCAARLADYRGMDWELARLPRPRPDARLRQEFYASLGGAARQGGGLRRGLSLAGRALELAMLSLLLLGLGLALGGWFHPVPDQGQATRPDQAYPSETWSGRLPADQSAPEGSPASMAITGDEPAVDGRGPGARGLEWAAPSGERPTSPLFQGSPTPQATATGEEGGRVYFVQADDTLWKLAEKYLGDGRRYSEIIQATHARRAQDASFALIEDPNRISPGSKLWIPAPGELENLAAVTTPSRAGAPRPVPATAGGPTGHIAFSFWNNHPARCTYEINVIDVAACLTGPAACQSTRRIFPLNNVSEPALSPDGERLEFRGWGEPPSADSPYLDCAPALPARYLANTTLDGTELRGTGGFWEDGHPDWSPDGRQILFDSQRHEDRISRIFLINADGSDERDLRIAGQHPSWAPDGQRFVYRGCDLTGNRCGLWLAMAAPVQAWDTGANMIGPLIQDDQAAHPDWSPVAGQIVYQSARSGSWDLYLVGVDDPAPRPLTTAPGIEGLPAWSPDGQWIAYLSDAGGNWGIWIMRADGGESHLLFPFDGGTFTPPYAVEPYGQRDWLDEQISWSQ
ncbi:MAG: hypothetical protein Kow0063_33000 [Anaerolineae bacterium]